MIATISSNMKPIHFGAPLWSRSEFLLRKGEFLERAVCLHCRPSMRLCSISSREEREVLRSQNMSREWSARYLSRSRVMVPGNTWLLSGEGGGEHLMAC